MRLIPYNPGPGGNNPQPVAIDFDGPQPVLVGGNQFVPAGIGHHPCLWSMVVNEGQGPCCHAHHGLQDAAVQAMDIANSLAAVSENWVFFQPAPVQGYAHRFVSPILIPEAEVANLQVPIDEWQLLPAAEVAATLQALKNDLALQPVTTHLHIAVVVDELPVVAADELPVVAADELPVVAADELPVVAADEADEAAEALAVLAVVD